MKRNFIRPIVPLIAVVAVVARLTMRTSVFNLEGRFDRRALLKLMSGALAALTTGAWRGRSARAAAAFTPACVLTPEQTEGPYFIANELVRSNIAEHRPGTPLRLRLHVMNARTCRPIRGAAVDIWHCDAGGVYSGFEAASTGGPPGGGAGPTDKHTFLRGVQITDAHGTVDFHTVYPGWYRGRTVHIHVKVHSGRSSHAVHTGQLYFPDGLTRQVYRASPYRSRAAARDTFNNTDGIYQSGGRQSMLTLTHDGHGGYVAAIAMGVRLA